MTSEQIIFFLTAAMILLSAIFVVSVRKILHAALWLAVSLFGIAILYAILQASFLAVIQVVIYIGAIVVLFIFAIMLTRRDQMEAGKQTLSNWWISGLIGVLILSGLLFLILNLPDVNRMATKLPAGFDGVQNLGKALVSANSFAVPFEVASILMLAALIGAVYVAMVEKKPEEK